MNNYSVNDMDSLPNVLKSRGHFGRRRILAIGGLTLAFIVALGGFLVGLPKAVNIQQGTAGPNRSIWSGEPMLEIIAGQPYFGRVVVEIWDKDASIFYNSDGEGKPLQPAFFERVTAALLDPQTPKVTSTPWSDEPAMGDFPGQHFRGRVVAEVWGNQVIVAVTGSGSDLIQRALQKLKEQ